MATFTIDGITEIRRAFRELPPTLAKKVIRQGMRTALKPVQAAAKALAPKDTGELARYIVVRAARARKRGVIALDVRVGEGDFKGEQFYAAFPEFGTSKQPAQHYMERAFLQERNRAKDIAIREISAGIDREVKALKTSL
jgi:HK97 gp10 family phage protein